METIRQLIFCLESNSKAKIDWIYIKEVVDSFFTYGNYIKFSPVYMGGKTNYKRDKTIKEIKSLTNTIRGESIVIYCIDADLIESDPDRRREFDEIKAYCSNEGYEFIWFHRNVEDVFLGRMVEQSEKIREAERFKRQALIKNVNLGKLRSRTETASQSSNIITILKKYLKTKEDMVI